jgi:hypothetical protein
VDQGADVLNMSEGGVANDSVLLAGSAYAAAAGVPVVVAMMNSNDSTPFYPAAHPQNIAVGATDTADRRAAPFSWGGGSNHGPHIDVVAPGNLVYGLGLDPGEYGTWWSGTSQATPAVAGLVALLLTVRPELDPEQVRAYLRDGAEDQVGRPGEDIAGFDVFHGAGRIDLRASLALLFADLGDGDGDGVAPVDGDCDDTDPAVLPGADELCDGLDTDCDGALPDGERDFDGDGALACEDDCDDGDASVGPQMVEDDAESCDDELDNDCDELIDRDDPECPKGCRSCEAPSGGRSSNRGSFAVLLFAAFGLRLRRRR